MISIALAGCVGTPTPSPSSPKPTATTTTPGTAAATPTPTASPVLLPKGTAQENLAYFDYVNQKTLASNPQPNGRAFIEGLVAAGFNKADMQVTADRTSINLTPGSLQFSVKFQGQCLIGQWGQAAGGYHSAVAAPISTGTCLIGDTAPINY
jgi:hypothetical protein